MLKGISPLLSPDLLATLARMGHGDEIVLADAHFPGHSVHENALRADGLEIAPLLDGILPLFELDSYVDAPVCMMATVEGTPRILPWKTPTGIASTGPRREPHRSPRSSASRSTSALGEPMPWS